MSEESFEPKDERTVQAEKKAESQRFNDVAEIYDQYRPGYPAELLADLLELSGIQPGGKILEIGSGTGIATQFFAQRGYSIVCLEPGQNMIDVAARKLADYPNVSFAKARFEDWEVAPGSFDLVISAQAFHWVPERVRFEKTARILKPHGALGLFWNMAMIPDMDLNVRRELDQVYFKYAPEFSKPETTVEQLIENRANSLRESPYYKDLIVRQYPWTECYETEAYLGLLNTYSDHLGLSRQRRALLFENIARVIDHHGGAIEKYYLAVVYIAKKVPDPL